MHNSVAKYLYLTGKCSIYLVRENKIGCEKTRYVHHPNHARVCSYTSDNTENNNINNNATDI